MRRSISFFTATILTLGLSAVGFAGVAAAGDQLTKKQFLKEGNAICKAARKDFFVVVDMAFAGLDENAEPPPEVIEAVVAVGIPILQDGFDNIEALEGPASLEKKVDKLVDNLFNAFIHGVRLGIQNKFWVRRTLIWCGIVNTSEILNLSCNGFLVHPFRISFDTRIKTGFHVYLDEVSNLFP